MQVHCQRYIPNRYQPHSPSTPNPPYPHMNPSSSRISQLLTNYHRRQTPSLFFFHLSPDIQLLSVLETIASDTDVENHDLITEVWNHDRTMEVDPRA